MYQRPRHFLLAASLLLASVAANGQQGDLPAPEILGESLRVVALSDVHGAHQALLRVLEKAEIVDSRGSWIGGTSRLVVVGDLVDRGSDSRAVMDMVRRLERQAPLAGGEVRLTLGNHEVMNLVGDLRYVSDGEYAAFAGDETDAQRDAGYAQHVAVRNRRGEMPLEREAFDRQFQPGFFAHRAAFSATGEYGAWLLQKPLVEVLDGTAFVHGGISPVVAERGASVFESQLAELQAYVMNLQVLFAAGVLDPTDDFALHVDLLQAFRDRVALGESSWPEAALEAAERLESSRSSGAFSSDSVLWYRGSVGCSPAIEDERLEEGLRSLNARRVVIGHTPTANGRVTSRLDGKVIRVDTGMLHDYYGGRAAALILQDEETVVIYEDGHRAAPWVDTGTGRLGLLDQRTEDLESILRSAEISRGQELADGRIRYRLQSDGKKFEAVFSPAKRRSKAFLPELAAYRLDRLLGMRMVPPTVEREIEGKPGSLQLVLETVDETQRTAAGAGGGAWCPLGDQFEVMTAFDALIHNLGRTPQNVRFLTSNWSVLLVGHGRAFSAKKGIPPYLRDLDLQLADELRERLEALDDRVLERELATVLPKKNRSALLGRRDQLIARSD